MNHRKPTIALRSLCGVALAPIPVPELFAQDLARAGHPTSAPVLGTYDRHSLADEFCHAMGYPFDWGVVLAGYPAWYCPEDHLPGCVWRVIPVALWERARSLTEAGCTIPEILAPLRLEALDALYPRFPHWVESDPGLAYDLCVPHVSRHEDAGRLHAWIERRLLPRLLPPVLRLLEARLEEHSRCVAFHTAQLLAPSVGGTLH